MITLSTGVLKNTPAASLYTGKNPPPYDNKQSEGEAPVMMELWGMRSTLSLALLSGPL